MKIGPSYFVRFSPDGDWLASCGERFVHVARFDVSKPEFSARLSNGAGADFAPDSRALLLKTTSGALHIVARLDSVAALKQLANGYGEGADPRYSRCGRFIVDASWSGHLVVLDSTTGAYVDHREFSSDMIVELACTASGDRWVVHHSPRATTASEPPDPDYFSIWSLPLPASPHRVIRPDLRFVRHSALSASGETLALNHGAPPVILSIVDVDTGQIRGETQIDVGGTGGRMTWTPNGKLAVVERDCLRIYSTESGVRVLARFDVRYACDVDFSPRGDRVAIGSWESGQVLPSSEILG